ncbi:MAG: thiamine phosphate synthase [Rhizomicrobium sp.]
MSVRLNGYYFITDTHLSRAGNPADVAAAVSAGVPVVQYRCKVADTRPLYDEARTLRAVCRGTATAFVVNDRVDIALAVGADGVHLGQDDMPIGPARRLLGPDKIIGLTVHNLAEARAAADAGADYLGVSPIFATATKQDAGPAAGLSLLKEIRAADLGLPLVAIGGISLTNAPSVIAAGADMVCAISAVVANADPSAAMAAFQRLF